MKKRFLCALLALIMLVSLVPATALTASAAGLSTSEAAITVLKQWNGYDSHCGANGYTGYGTKCEIKATHGAHTITEKQADAALREALKELDSAINSFASNAGLSLSQSQHDALVLFSFDNGTAWTTGTGSFRSAVVNRLTGSDFLNAICRWNASLWDDDRRKVEANMYLNGIYSSSVPSSFITVGYYAGYAEEPAFDANGDPILDEDGNPVGTRPVYGSIGSVDPIQYYDVSNNPAPNITPTLKNHTFTGWYETTLDFNSYADINEIIPVGDADPTTRVTALTSKHNYKILMAGWVETDPAYDDEDLENGNVGVSVYYIIPSSQILSSKVYKVPNGERMDDESVSDYYFEQKSVRVDRDYIDGNGVRWCKIYGENRWIKVAKVGTTGSYDAPEIDVTVTVTNSYVRSRVNETIYSAQNGTYYQGDKLRIINTAQADGFLWGQVAKSATDNTPIGWVALMYTNWESVRNETNVNHATVVATATVTDAAYVNLRSEPGTDKKIVGALPMGTLVDLYEIKYVNGHQWGRCNTGWFCLSYAEVTMLTNDTSYTDDVNYLSYVFTGTLGAGARVYQEPNESSTLVKTYNRRTPGVTITKLAKFGDITWGKIAEGWVTVSDANGNPMSVDLDTAKYTITAETLTVRDNPSHSANRVDTLVKGVEFDVNSRRQIIVTDDSVWAWAYKVGEDNITYNGWVNLASTGVTRGDLPTVEEEENGASISGMMATVINTDSVNVREYNDATYAKIGSLARGTTVAVWEEEDGWYKIDSNRNGEYDYEGDGWVSAQYLNVFESDSSSSGSTGSTGSTGGTVETGLGIVANTYTGVNVRTGAGIAYPTTGKILAGTTVEILEVTTVGAAKWGRVTQGWICLDYVTMISNYPIAGSTGSSSTGSSTGTSTNTTASESVIFTGKIIADNTEVYTEPNTRLKDVDPAKVRIVSAGTPVTVHELLVVEETEVVEIDENTTQTHTYKRYWARTNDGYIVNPGLHIELDALAEKTYTVTSYKSSVDNELDVYTEAASGVETGSTLNKYDQVSVTVLKIVDNQLWCRVEYTDDAGSNQVGYVQMKYLTAGAVANPATSNNNTNSNTNTNTGANGTNGTNGTTGNIILGSSGNTANQGTNGYVNNTAGYRYTGRVIRTGSLNVRARPSQTAQLTTTLKSGAALVIYETTVSEGMAWGRCDAGWVYLYYVDLQPCNTAVDAMVVYNENTIAYTDANCTAVAGTYSRMSVVDIYEKVGSMCRTDVGWVHIDNLG